MKWNKEQIRQIVIDSILELLQGDGRGELPPIIDQTDPIRELELTSQDGIEIACLLSYKLGFEIPPGINPFKDDARRRSRRIGEIVNLLLQLQEQKEVTDHA
jgi:hypothetical protein